MHPCTVSFSLTSPILKRLCRASLQRIRVPTWSRSQLWIMINSWLFISAMWVSSPMFSSRRVFGSLIVLQVIDELHIYSSAGQQVERLAANFVGSISLSGGKREYPWFFATLSGFTTPGTIQKYDFKAPSEMKWSVYRTTEVNGLVPEDFLAEQVSDASQGYHGMNANIDIARFGIRARTGHEFLCSSSAIRTRL